MEDYEVVEGAVSEVHDFGTFVRIGPMEALLHKSQIMSSNIVMIMATHGQQLMIQPVQQEHIQLNQANIQQIFKMDRIRYSV